MLYGGIRQNDNKLYEKIKRKITRMFGSNIYGLTSGILQSDYFIAKQNNAYYLAFNHINALGIHNLFVGGRFVLIWVISNTIEVRPV